MYAIGRKAEIISMLEQNGEVDVNMLSARFKISRETVRRDLKDLEREGVLTRTHGGGILNAQRVEVQSEYPVAIRSIQRFPEKNLICQHAAKYVEDGDTIFVDNSSTTMYLCKFIPKNLRITLITNSLMLLLEASQVKNPNIQYICLGGSFGERNFSFYGNATLKNAESYYPNRSFLGCAGIRSDGVTSDGSIHSVETKQLMIKQSKETLYMVDFTKFLSFGSVYLSRLKRGDKIITDDKTDQELLKPIRAIGAEVEIVSNGVAKNRNQ
jgi:DeoR family fructose operon transcriptional repressor